MSINLAVPSQPHRTRKDYVSFCRREIEEAKKALENRLLIQYRRDHRGQKLGVVCTYVLNGKQYVGASKCNRRLNDQFDRHIGIYQALRHSYSLSPSDFDSNGVLNQFGFTLQQFPLSMHKLVVTTAGHGRYKFFTKKENVSTEASETVASTAEPVTV